VKIVLAPQLEVRFDQPSMPWSELQRYGAVEVADDTNGLIRDIVRQVITDRAATVVGAEPDVDAPPFTPGLWWLATVATKGERATTTSFEPREAVGIDADGLVRFAYPRELSVADLVRAIDEGHYPTDEHTLVVTRTGEFGGNGHAIESLVLWLLQEFPVILLGVGVDRAMLRRDARKQEDLEELAADWAGRHILYPMSLRLFVESKHAWYAAVLARRLSISEAAALRLLKAVGYASAPHDPDLMEYSEEREAEAARQMWLEAEWQSTFTSIDELLEADFERPEPSTYETAHTPVRRRGWGRLREWFVAHLRPDHE